MSGGVRLTTFCTVTLELSNAGLTATAGTWLDSSIKLYPGRAFAHCQDLFTGGMEHLLTVLEFFLIVGRELPPQRL